MAEMVTGNILPQVEERIIEPRFARFILRVPTDLDWFAGHFDNMPVLPGVVLIQWAAHFARESYDTLQFTGELKALKFRNLILPGCRLELILDLNLGPNIDLKTERSPKRSEVKFCFRSDQREYARGSLLVGPVGAV